MHRIGALLVILSAVGPEAVAQAQPASSAPADEYVVADRIFDEFRLDAHIPGLAYGIVADGRLVHVGALGVQDIESQRSVTPDTLFRIASMTKAFTALTILKLRDEGRLRLDAPAGDYIPELRAWRYPTDDSPEIRVRDLLSHAAGFVSDDPWGDRQTPLPEEEFTRLLRDGVPFTSTPATRYEYSNLGYALLGRIITNVSKQPYADTIARTLLRPLRMDASGFVAEAAPREHRALGYRWEDDAWRLEPTLGPGAFGAMGGVQTSVNDDAKWVEFLLSAWPARNGTDAGPVRRATVRELAQGLNFPRTRDRNARAGAPTCRQAATYGMGMSVAVDCDLGRTLSHGGGYPGYGSYVLLLPDRGMGIFAMANRTYAGPSVAVWDAAVALNKAGLLGKDRDLPASEDVLAAYKTVGALYAAGDVTGGREHFAMNFLLDRDAQGWSRKLATLKAQVGECDTTSSAMATGALSADFTWRCAHGRVEGSLSLAPTHPPRIQQWLIEAVAP